MVLACPPNNVLGRALGVAYSDPTTHVPRLGRGRRNSCTAETYWRGQVIMTFQYGVHAYWLYLYT